MIMNVVKYSSLFVTFLCGFHFLKSERERILLLLKEKEDELQLSKDKIQELEEKLTSEKNRNDSLLSKYLIKEQNKISEPSSESEPTPYNSCDEGKELDTELDTDNTELDTDNTELDTDNTNYDDINNLQNDTSEDSIEELVHSDEKNNDNNDDTNDERGVIEYTN